MNGTSIHDRKRTLPVTIGISFLSDAGTRRRFLLILCAAAVVVLASILIVYGWDYYFLSQSLRPFSPKHALLKPSGRIGLRLGFLGLGLFMLVYLYPLRKRWPWLAKIGSTKNWLDFHILLGLSAPVVITFHSSFKVRGFAGMAYWTMIALVVSGLVGRYFYAQIPRSLGAAEMSMQEAQDLGRKLMSELQTQQQLSAADLETLFRLPDSRKVESMSIWRFLPWMIWLDLMRPFRVWSLRRRMGGLRERIFTLGGILRSGRADLERAIAIASSQAGLAKRILFLSKTRRVFHLWHIIHRPFSLSFAVFVILHVAVVMWFGYF